MKNSLVFLMMILLFAACKKVDSNPISPIQTQDSVTDYLPLEVGNYWIYECYTADSTLVFVDNNTTDSIYVEKDSLVNGNIYKVLRSSSVIRDVFLIRDSADCLVLANGRKMFTLNHSIEILAKQYLPGNDTTHVLIWKMNNSDSVSIVPSGQYNAKYVLGTLNSTIPNDPNYNERKLFYAYSKNIGLVSRRLSYLCGESYIEERLIRFNLSTK